MKILVLVKQSAQLENKFEIEGSQIDEKYFDFEISEADEYAIEEAVQIKESEMFSDVEIVIASIGPARTVEAIQYSLGMGADRGIRIWDDDLEERDTLTPQLKSEIFYTLVADENPDLVLSGVHSSDDLYGATGVLLAQKSGYQWSAAVTQLEINTEAETIITHREVEGGDVEVTEIPLPSVLTVHAGINDPRYVSRRTLYRDTSASQITEFELDDLADDFTLPAQSISVNELSTPEGDTQYFEGETENVATQIIELFREKGGMT
jgi:electron transfer flavoprotein beta subunit